MEASTEITVIDKSLEVISTGGQVLISNISRADKAVTIGDKILADINAGGGKLNPELDTRCLNYLANCNKAIKEMNDARKPVTQVMDKLKSLFIEQEGRLDNNKPKSKAATIQKYRDGYALQLQQEEDARRRQADMEARKNEEAISLKAACERQLQDYFLTILSTCKRDMQNDFNAITLDKFYVESEDFKSHGYVFSYEAYQSFKPSLLATYHSIEERQNIATNVTSGRFNEFTDRFDIEINDLKSTLIDHLPSRKKELELLAQANDEQRLRIEAEQERRQKEDEERIKQEEENARKASEQKIELQASQESVNNLFDRETTLAISTPKPEARNSYDIEILHPGALPLIFQLWFTEEGSKLPIEKSEKVTLKAMKTFCEGYAKKYDVKIESPHLRYNTAVKAINRKTA